MDKLKELIQNNPNKQICVIIGTHAEKTSSPKMHNAAYKALEIEDEYIFTSCNIANEKELKEFFDLVKKHPHQIRGITVTMPHKKAVMQYLNEIDSTAEKIGAVNTIVNNNGHLTGYNTDWIGIKTPLEQKLGTGGIKNKKVLMLGAGGAAQAVAYTIEKERGELTIRNRNYEKAKKTADKFNGNAIKEEELTQKEIGQYDIIINTTPLGSKGEKEKLDPLEGLTIGENQIVFDIIYKPKETKLLKKTKQKNKIYGWEMLVHQGIPQFLHYIPNKKEKIEKIEKVMEKSLDIHKKEIQL